MKYLKKRPRVLVRSPLKRRLAEFSLDEFFKNVTFWKFKKAPKKNENKRLFNFFDYSSSLTRFEFYIIFLKNIKIKFNITKNYVSCEMS